MQTDIAVISKRFKEARRGFIPKIGAVALRFTDTRFSEQGWVDYASHPWKRRKGNSDPGRAILIKTGALRRANRIVTSTEHSVTLGNDLPYAKPLNEGFRGRVQVPAHIRRRSLSARKSNVKRKKEAYKYIGPINVRPFTMHMNLVARPFMGESYYLRKQIKRLITAEVNRCFQ